MKLQRRTNPLWGLVLLALALFWGARTLGYVPDGLFDAIMRAWPVLLVLAGLSFVFRRRLPFSGFLALVVCVVLAVSVAASSFSSRASQLRTENRQVIDQSLSAVVSLLRVRVEGLSTDVEFLRSLDATDRVTGEFVGSSANSYEVQYMEAVDNSATLTLREVQVGGFPMLDAVGRGTLRIELPNDLPLDVDFVGQDGTASFNMSGLSLERLNAAVASGDLLVTLPDYAPLFAPTNEMLGTLTTRSGDLTLFVPRSVAARLDLNREGSGLEPQYDPTVYNYLVGDVLEARDIGAADVVLQYTLTVPRGRIRVEAQ